MLVFAFDRDWTVDVNPHPRHEAVPLEWVRHLAHETEHAVYAIGNQDLKYEADILGVTGIVGRHEDDWDEWLGDKQADGYYENFPTRRERLKMLAEIHPEAAGYIVVDDLDLSDVEGWDHYHAWEFVPAVRQGDIDPSLPWAQEPQTDGGWEPRMDGGCPAPERTLGGIVPAGPDHLDGFLQEFEDAPAYEITHEGNGSEQTDLCADVTLDQPTVDRPAAAPTVTCTPISPAAASFTVRVDAIERLSVVEPPTELYTKGAETPAERATGLRRLAAADATAVDVSSLLPLVDQDAPQGRRDALHALYLVARTRPEDCLPALPRIESVLTDETRETPPGALAVLRVVAETAPGAVAPLVDAIRPSLVEGEKVVRVEAAKCFTEIAADSPEDIVDAVPELATALEDEAPGQGHAVYALNCVAKVAPAAVEPVADTLADRLSDDELSETTRSNATAALGRVVSEYPDVAPDLVDDVVALLDADSPKLRANAAGLLSDAARPHTVAIRPHLDRILPLLEDDDPFARVNASATVSRLAEDFPADVAPHQKTLIGLLEDDHELVRINACWALGYLGERATDAVADLEDLVQRETEEDVLVRAQWAIAEIEG